MPAVVAGLFDIAENSMTGRALDELMRTSLTDATVADITLASQLKWTMLGIALLIVAWRCWSSVRHNTAALLCVLGGLAMILGAWFMLIAALHVGGACMLAGLGLLAWIVLREPLS